MKRSIPIAMVAFAVLLIVLPSNLISSRASEDVIERQDAIALVRTAIELRTSMGMGFQWYEGGASRDFFEKSDISDRIRPVNKPEQYPFHSFFKVKDGYDPASIKQLITETFTNKIAESIIENSKTFFDLYYEENGVWFYGYYYGGDKFSFEDGDRPYTYFEPAEIEDMKILKNIEGNAIVSVPVHRNYNECFDGSPENARIKTEVLFFLSNSSGKWKIDGTDFSNMIFRADKSVPSDGELTEAFVRESIIAVVCDLDSMLRLNAYNRLCTYGLGKELGQHKIFTTSKYDPPIVDGDTVIESITLPDLSYNILEGNLADVSTWEDYANCFCTEAATAHILEFDYTDRRVFMNKGKYLTFMRDLAPEKLYFLYPEASVSYNIMAVSAQYGLQNIADDKITINTIDETHAEVVYEFRPYVVEGSDIKKTDPLTTSIQYLKTENGWRINSTEFIDELNERILSNARFGLNNLNTVVEDQVISSPRTGDPVSVWYILTAFIFAGSVLVKKKAFG